MTTPEESESKRAIRLASDLDLTASKATAAQARLNIERIQQAAEPVASAKTFAELNASSLSDRMKEMLEELRGSSMAAVARQVRDSQETPAAQSIRAPLPNMPRPLPSPVPDLLREQQETSALMLEALLAVKKAQEEAAATLQTAAKAQEEATSREVVRDKHETRRWWALFVIALLGLIVSMVR